MQKLKTYHSSPSGLTTHSATSTIPRFGPFDLNLIIIKEHVKQNKVITVQLLQLKAKGNFKQLTVLRYNDHYHIALARQMQI